MNTPETNVIELLKWAKEHGFTPRTPARNDLFLEPISRRLIRYRHLQPHQRRTAYWVPHPRGLEQLGLRLQAQRISGMIILKACQFIGAGTGEHEAAMSMVNHIRGEFRASIAA